MGRAKRKCKEVEIPVNRYKTVLVYLKDFMLNPL